MKKFFLPLALLTAAGVLLAACGKTPDPAETPGGNGQNVPAEAPGGGQDVPAETVSDNAAAAAEVAGVTEAATALPADIAPIPADGAISEAGDYLITGAFAGKVEVTAGGVHLYLQDAALTNAKKVIESAGDLTLTLLGENSVTNTNADGANAIDCAGKLTVNGTGELSVTSTKNGISANAIAVRDAALTVEAAKDGLHAEIDYDDLTAAPSFSYEAGGWVVLDGATLTIVSTDDGIQADTFVLVRGESALDITTNGGAPQTITELSSDSGDGKGIKAGAIDWGADDAEIVSEDYLIAIEGGTVNIDANDDAVHSDGELVVSGGALTVAAGDDALHAEALLTFAGGSATVSRCYEGLEAAKVEIAGGIVSVTSVDDGINAADGTTALPGQPNANCRILITGGTVEVNAEGDGLDSNGTLTMTGGTVFVSGPTGRDNAALDADGELRIDGGSLLAVGPVGMMEAPSSSSAQNVVVFAHTAELAAGTRLSLTGEDGGELLSYTAKKRCQSVILSCPDLETGKRYSICGDSAVLCSFTVSARITTAGETGGMGGPGGPGGSPGRPGFPGGRW